MIGLRPPFAMKKTTASAPIIAKILKFNSLPLNAKSQNSVSEIKILATKGVEQSAIKKIIIAS